MRCFCSSLIFAAATMRISLLFVVSLLSLLSSSLHHANCKLTEDQWNRALKRAQKKLERKSRVITGRIGDEIPMSHTRDVIKPARETISALKIPPPVAQTKSTRTQLAIGTLTELRDLIQYNGSLNQLQSTVIQELPQHMEAVCGRETVNCSAIDVRFRTMNGTCNNLLHPFWGSANYAYKRYLPASYDDGISAPQGTRTRSLPSARQISVQLSQDVSHPSEQFSLMLMQWGQFLDHDITHTPAVDTDQACNNNKCKTTDSCFPIKIPANDPLFEMPCLMFGRSIESCDGNSALPRNQLNSITSFIDASNVYGSSEKEIKEMRDFESVGLMRVLPLRYTTASKNLLPHQSSSDPLSRLCRCRCGSPQRDCFRAGDIRANEVISLTAMHTVWIREHNRIASRLADLNRCWDSDRVFYETRKIIGAIMQHITYNEYLPLILGKSGMDKYRIRLHRLHASHQFYDPTINPGIANVFATAAFRFGHSQLQNDFPKQTHRYYDSHHPFLLNNSFFCPSSIYSNSAGGIDSILRGLLMASSQTVDLQLAKTVTSHLFADPPSSPGLDLFALNVQRGRDHGIPLYIKWRDFCGLDSDTTTTFDTLSSDIPTDTLDTLKSIYKSVDDIDLFVGGLAETHVQDGAVGRTFQCILGHQFHELQRGDSFWFETQGQFTPRQSYQIKQVSLAKVLCNNGDWISEIQPRAFETVDSTSNRIVSCSLLPEMDLHPWKKKGCRVSQHTEIRSTNECMSGSWGEWSVWSSCSKMCGIGEQMRMRACNDSCLRCEGFYLDSKCCVGECVESGSGNSTVCCTSWSSWGPCDRRCAGGTQTRHRQCNSSKCPHSHTRDKQTCNLKPCPVADYDLFHFGRHSLS